MRASLETFATATAVVGVEAEAWAAVAGAAVVKEVEVASSTTRVAIWRRFGNPPTP